MKKPPRTADAFVGKKIRFRRRELKLSQEQLAAKIGLTFQQIQKYENGTNRVSASRLVELAQILEVPAAYFFDGLETASNRKGELSDLYKALSTHDVHRLVSAFVKIKSKTMRHDILQLLETIAES